MVSAPYVAMGIYGASALWLYVILGLTINPLIKRRSAHRTTTCYIQPTIPLWQFPTPSRIC